jgi:hypothetical protein
MASGEFSFFLDNGAVRVTRKQEKTLEGEVRGFPTHHIPTP